MAALSKHGNCVIIEFIWYRKAYCEDGKVFKNIGFGWKEYGRIMTGYDYRDVAKRKIEARDASYANSPAVAAFKTWMHHHVRSWPKRAYLKQALFCFTNDPDGMWVELNDHPHDKNIPRLEIDECRRVTELYRAMLDEHFAKHRDVEATQEELTHEDLRKPR